jgi:hypothetical protein
VLSSWFTFSDKQTFSTSPREVRQRKL